MLGQIGTSLVPSVITTNALADNRNNQTKYFEPDTSSIACLTLLIEIMKQNEKNFLYEN